ncbi:unnamed protein product [Camellia sinensis]
MPVKSASGTQSQNEDFLAEHTIFNEGNSLKGRCQGLFSFLRVIPAFTESFSESDEDDLKTDAFSQMHKIRLLQLNNVRLSGRYQKFSKKLRWLCWHGFPLKSIPNDFTLDSLVALEMQNSSLEQLWKRTKLQSCFCTFRNDDDAMERGELEKVIKESRSSIIVFLKDYASSRRCLDELVMILECKRNFKHVILPVFYGMDPPQVRKQTGSVVEAFAGHEAQFEVEIDERNGKLGMKKVKGWREALREVVDLGGM